MSGEGGFLSRWSRRKRATRTGRPAEGLTAEAPPPAAAAPPAEVASAEAAPAFDPAGLPPPESLTADSDFAAFLRDEVPAALKRVALRRAWTLDPSIRDFIGPADYAWDFNAPDGVPGFALDLPGDVGRLVAQAVGLDPAADAAPEEAEAPAAEAPAAPAAAAESPTEPEAGGAPPAIEEAPRIEPVGESDGEAPPAPAVAAAQPAPARRRHGGARPT